MATLNAIGNFSFQSLSRPPEAPRQTVELESRSGVDDVAVWRTGIRRDPFAVVSVVDVATQAAGDILYRTYEGLVGGDPVTLVWAGVTIAAARYVVLEVRLLENHKLLLGAGGLNGGSVLLRAEWTLQPVIL